MTKIYLRVLTVTAFVVPVLTMVSARGMVIALMTAAVAAGFAYRREVGSWPIPRAALPSALAVLVVWGVVSAVWSVSAAESLITSLKLTCLFAAGLVLTTIAARTPERDRPPIRKALVVGFIIALGMMSVEVASEAYLTRTIHRLFESRPVGGLVALNAAACTLALLAWPAIGILARTPSRLTGPAVFVATAATLLALESQSAQIAFIAGGIIYLLAVRWGRMVAKAIQWGVLVLFVTAPILPRALPAPEVAIDMRPELSFSAIHRIAIWQFASDRILEKPAIGWGMDSSRAFTAMFAHDLPARYRDANVENQRSAMLAYFTSQPLPLHPHNGVLQAWLELGVVGALAVAAILILVVDGIARVARRNHAAAPLFALFSTGALIFGSTFGAWQSWWQAALWLVGAMAIAVVEDADSPDGDARR